MQCVDCHRLRHEGDCPACEGCGWPLQPGMDRLCEECLFEVGEIAFDDSKWEEHHERTN